MQALLLGLLAFGRAVGIEKRRRLMPRRCGLATRCPAGAGSSHRSSDERLSADKLRGSRAPIMVPHEAGHLVARLPANTRAKSAQSARARAALAPREIDNISADGAHEVTQSTTARSWALTNARGVSG